MVSIYLVLQTIIMISIIKYFNIVLKFVHVFDVPHMFAFDFVVTTRNRIVNMVKCYFSSNKINKNIRIKFFNQNSADNTSFPCK